MCVNPLAKILDEGWIEQHDTQVVERVLAMEVAAMDKESQGDKVILATKHTPPAMNEEEYQRNKRGVRGRKKKNHMPKVTTIPSEWCGKPSSCVCSSFKLIVNGLVKLMGKDGGTLHIF